MVVKQYFDSDSEHLRLCNRLEPVDLITYKAQRETDIYSSSMLQDKSTLIKLAFYIELIALEIRILPVFLLRLFDLNSQQT
jgi:hypothetical protein